MVTVKSVPEGVQAVFPMLVCRSPEAEMNFCAAAFPRRISSGATGRREFSIHLAMSGPLHRALKKRQRSSGPIAGQTVAKHAIE